jgi:hypothetical protein
MGELNERIRGNTERIMNSYAYFLSILMDSRLNKGIFDRIKRGYLIGKINVLETDRRN